MQKARPGISGGGDGGSLPQFPLKTSSPRAASPAARTGEAAAMTAVLRSATPACFARFTIETAYAARVTSERSTPSSQEAW